uniref:NaTx n=1 Tax=Centruroides hentzi TaxID=88313 RepID=A0A2I9LP93_9SCOR
MKIIIAFISALLLLGVESARDGYPVDKEGCKISCVINSKFCNTICHRRGAKYGYCYTGGLACYCEAVPDNVKVWTYATNTCGKK